MLSATQLLRLKQAAHDAVLCEQATKVPAELTVGQWALESGWGGHQPGNNCFGIKAYAGCFGIQSMETHEFQHDGHDSIVVQEFATFPSLAACFQKHADLISGARPYSVVWSGYVNSGSLEQLLAGIAPIYATDPAYAGELWGIIRMAPVQFALTEFRDAITGLG